MSFSETLQCMMIFKFSWFEIFWNSIWGGVIAASMYHWGFKNGQKSMPREKPKEPSFDPQDPNW